MAITVTRVGASSFAIGGIEKGQSAKMLTLANRCGRAIQKRIHALFETSRYGGGALKANSAEYNINKILSGFDPRRGHRTGALASAIKNQKLWRLSVKGKRIIVSFSTKNIRGRAAVYVRFYERTKAPLGLLLVRTSWLKDCLALFKRETKPKKKAKAKKKKAARRDTPRILIRTLSRRLGERVEVGSRR